MLGLALRFAAHPIGSDSTWLSGRVGAPSWASLGTGSAPLFMGHLEPIHLSPAGVYAYGFSERLLGPTFRWNPVRHESDQEDGESPMERPKLDFSTLPTLWRPELALQIIERVRVEKGSVKPRYFRALLPASCTEAERYTAEMLRRMCDVAFGAHADRNVVGRQRIWTANAEWLKHNIPFGKGVRFEELAGFVALYTRHIREDNAR